VKDTLLALGAVAARYRERLPVTVVGITGSVGKTSTARMTTAVLATRLHVAATKDDWNAEIGVPMMLLGLSARTQVAVIEMAMRHLGDIHYLVEIARPSIGVVTNIAESHMELLGSLENIVRAKGELIEGLPADGIAVLNAADPLALGLQRLHRGRVLTYGMESAAAVRAADITGHAQGSTFRLMTPTGTIDMALPVPGWHQVSNALAACAVATALDVDLEGMREGLARYTTPKMRLQVMPLGAIDLINDAYNASPLSTRAALAVLAEVAGPRRKLVVFGDMLELGSLAVAAHRAVGDEMARAQIAGLVTIGDLARHVAERARAGGVPEVVQAGTWQEGVEAITAMLRPGDVLLVKASRGMALERVVEALVARVDRVAAPPGRPEASSSNRLGCNG
ncbi:MAG: UDP-N-acetylmuramoyl-tripeptide--D-alanyl-D-alanine ligase, partial [Armatimonadetes bacterium]|nr:UDP-N-acetylmuramoyl-tripeptide--D-alanyl-D-alanine ligase [Armatimonadota bacterium]